MNLMTVTPDPNRIKKKDCDWSRASGRQCLQLAGPPEVRCQHHVSQQLNAGRYERPMFVFLRIRIS